MRTLTPVNGQWSEEANAWVSETLFLTGEHWLELSLPAKGRIVVKMADTAEGPFPKALISKWAGPDFSIRIYGSDVGHYFRFYLTNTPTTIQIVDLNKQDGGT